MRGESEGRGREGEGVGEAQWLTLSLKCRASSIIESRERGDDLTDRTRASPDWTSTLTWGSSWALWGGKGSRDKVREAIPLLPLLRHSPPSHRHPPSSLSHLAVPAWSCRALCQNLARSSFTGTLAKNMVESKVASCWSPPPAPPFSTILPTSSRQWSSSSSRTASMSSWQSVS